MTLLVPYDGSDLAKTALRRAQEFAHYRDEDVVAVSVVPDEAECARERGWIDEDVPDENFEPTAICDRFASEVAEIAPAASFRCEHPERSQSFSATVIDDVTRTIRQVADELDVSIVFIGSENAGRVSRPISSVGSPISEDPRYDVHIVRHVGE